MANAVVVVPGILGSSLGYRVRGGPLKELWYNSAWLGVHGADDLQLAEDGDSPGPLARMGNLEPMPQVPSWGAYSTVMARLLLEGWEATWFAYDWRKSITEAAARFASFVLEKYSGQDYYVLAHSMGGLVTRLAYGLVVAAGGAARWKRTLYVGTPHAGSYQAAQYLAKPDQSLPMWGWMGLALSGPVAPAIAAVVLSGKNRAARQVVASWPALYELLPDTTGTWSQGRPLDNALWQATTYFDQNPFVQTKWMTEGQETRVAINATLTAPRPAERVVIGTNTPTPSALVRASKVGDASAYSSASGDGSVPEARAVLPGTLVKLELQGGLHSDLLADARFLPFVSSLLLDGDPVERDERPLKQEIVLPTRIVEIVPIATIPFTAMQRRGDP